MEKIIVANVVHEKDDAPAGGSSFFVCLLRRTKEGDRAKCVPDRVNVPGYILKVTE